MDRQRTTHKMPLSQSIRIAAVGDIMFGDGIQRIRRGVRAAWEGKEAAQLLQHLRPVFKRSDLCIGNLECMLGPVDPIDPRKMIYKGESRHLSGLKSVGFSHLSLANNHILEQGLEVAEATRDDVTGAGITACCGPNPVRLKCAGTSVDIFTYNLVHDTPSFGFYRDRVENEDLEAISASDAALKIVCIHWGHEFSEYPSPEQIDLAHRLVDSGAGAILGHHPHVVQGVESYKGAVIAYSLGNFVFDMNWNEKTRSAFILKIEFRPGMPATFNKLSVSQDGNFVPQLTDASEYMAQLDRDVLRYSRDSMAYARYARRHLRSARLKAILNLCSRFYDVDPKTWEILIAKRLVPIRRMVRRTCF